ncbi:MAG: tRNA (guanosine(37)-N1)-methyltransferase TrmD [Gammaproteobacteria bacterium]|nr:tRNA (guanosine(37)-N1)-methyltransferase TrmD [Gammaproteobacteria bacterium]
MRFDLITLFPDTFTAVTEHGVTSRALKQDLYQINFWNPRDYTQDRHRTVDDRPYGGGPGMVMMIEPLRDAIHAARESVAPDVSGQSRVIMLSPQGAKLDQQKVLELSKIPQLILVSGRYEGIDERLIQSEIDEELSIGDFILSGGELAAMVVIDAVVRQIPGALGHQDSAEQDSFSNGLLDCPHYTRPEVFEGRAVPEVLLSGNHKLIDEWRMMQSLGRTAERRPDLLEKATLDQKQQNLLQKYRQGTKNS